ncbi:MAG TPA: hypothetical protein VHB98_03040, partial [Chloroflexota bacterium]|nr:hypothetical protein [Chloroflexota bacterium]
MKRRGGSDDLPYAGKWQRGRTLPLRLWLILVVMAIIGASGVVEVAVAVVIYHGAGQAGWHAAGQVGEAQLASVRQIIGTDAAQWRQPAWQRRAASALGALGVDVALFAGGPDHLTFATPGARQLLDTSMLATAGGSTGSSGGQQDSQPSTPSSTALPTFDRLTIT